MAGKMLLTISRDEEERARIMNIEKSELDWQSKMVEAKRAGRRELQEDLLRLLDGDKNHTMEDIRKMLAGR